MPRPKPPEPWVRFVVRLPATDLARIKAAAEACGMAPSVFIARSAAAAAWIDAAAADVWVEEGDHGD